MNSWLRARSVVAAGVAIVIAGCGAVHRDKREQVELWGLGREGEVVADMIPEFERRNPGIHVLVQQIPWTAAHEKLLTAYVGNATPDVAQMGNSWIPEFAAVNALKDLSPLARTGHSIDPADYFAGVWSSNVVGSSVFGIPWYVDARVMFYRTDVLAAVGYPDGPRTWDAWKDAMLKIVAQKKCRYAILMPTNEWEHLTTIALSNHATLLDANGTHGAFEDPAFREAFAFYIWIYRNGLAPKVSNLQVSNLYQQFAQKDFAMYMTGPWNIGEFRRRLPPEMQGLWATAPLPARDASTKSGISMAGGSSLVVFKASRHAAASGKLIEYLSEPAQQMKFYELTGDLPARKSAWSAASLVNDPQFPAFREQLESVEALPKVPQWEEIATEIYLHGEAVIFGGSSEDAALKDLDKKTEGILEKRRWILARQGAAPRS